MSRLEILSRSETPFFDRHEAGKLLGAELQRFWGKNAVVLGIPRGGMVIADEIATVIDGELDMVLARKIGAPGNPEFAIGAVGESGEIFLNNALLDQLGLPGDFTAEKERELATIKERTRVFRKVHPKVSLQNRIVILTDDGVATGATMQAALWNVCQQEPKKIIVALPVGPEDTLTQLAKDADEVICLRVPESLSAISRFYIHFDQVENEEVLEILKHDAKRRHSHA